MTLNYQDYIEEEADNEWRRLRQEAFDRFVPKQERKTVKTIATLKPADPSLTARIPERILESINLYATQGIPTGAFVQAVLSNDLMSTIKFSNTQSLNSIVAICYYVHNILPANCHGSPDAYRNHLEKAQS